MRVVSINANGDAPLRVASLKGFTGKTFRVKDRNLERRHP